MRTCPECLRKYEPDSNRQVVCSDCRSRRSNRLAAARKRRSAGLKRTESASWGEGLGEPISEPLTCRYAYALDTGGKFRTEFRDGPLGWSVPTTRPVPSDPAALLAIVLETPARGGRDYGWTGFSRET